MEIAAAPVERSGEAKRTVGVARQRAKQKARLGLRLKAGGSHRTGQGPMVPEVLIDKGALGALDPTGHGASTIRRGMIRITPLRILK